MDAKVCSLGKTAICDLRVHSLNFLCALTFDERVRAPCMIPDYLLLREEELVLVSPQAHKPPQEGQWWPALLRDRVRSIFQRHLDTAL